MNIRTFEGSSMNEAVKAVRDSFGRDAVILKTQEYPRENGRRLFRVTATNDPSKTEIQGDVGNSESNIEIMRMLKDLDKKIDRVMHPLATKEQLITLDSRIDDVRKIVFTGISGTEQSLYKGHNESIRDIIQYLQVMNVDGGVVMKLGTYLESLPPPSALHENEEEYYKAYAIRWMMKRLQIIPMFNDDFTETRAFTFLGSSGCGKSSLVLKIASYISKNSKKTPIVVSFDMKKIAASEQVRVYCKILGLEHKNASNMEELRKMSASLADDIVLLVDTSSYSTKNARFYEDLKELSELDIPTSTCLVLSLAEKSCHLDRILKGFTKVGIDGLAFTKMDEVWNYGDIFNISFKWGLGLTVFGIGDEVPNDLEIATRERVVERIFGLRG